MNCLDFRRTILANPRQPGEAERAHALECAPCRVYLERQRELDAELYAALQVPPPDGLADRILVARGLRPRNARLLWAIAATVLIAAGIALLGRAFFLGDALGREAIAHVAEEPQSFSTTHAVSSDFLPALLAEQGIKTLRAVGQVTYARVCPMDGRVARHLVVRTTDGLVTVFLMPDDSTRRRRALTQREGMAALTLPTARGTIAIVASDLAHVLAFERALQAT